MTQMPQTVGNVAYTYVQDAEPSNPAEGETWYDTGANGAYVWDGAAWIEQTIEDHANLSNVTANQHHRESGAENGGYTGSLGETTVISSYDVSPGVVVSDLYAYVYAPDLGSSNVARTIVRLHYESGNTRDHVASQAYNGSGSKNAGSLVASFGKGGFSGKVTKIEFVVDNDDVSNSSANIDHDWGVSYA